MTRKTKRNTDKREVKRHKRKDEVSGKDTENRKINNRLSHDTSTD